jgi:DNA-binding NarL/FixJ family response regulator
MNATVLIADDNPEMLKHLAGFLSPFFSVVGLAGDGGAALRAIEELCPQLAVLDVSMPVMTGFDVARKLNLAKSSTRVVFCTFMKGEDFIAEARRLGHGYVLKQRLDCDLPAALDAALKGEFFASPM